SSRLNSETPIAKAIGVLFLRAEKPFQSTESSVLRLQIAAASCLIVPGHAFYATALGMAIMPASL
ncbi:hypothetical protein ACIQF9_29945, partial [Pseudomonas chlororaphis]|uniref:hypothetical protein n=1 Tax=Pseudomonas chlororaphis TaxID=587753 RepID=UPI00381119D9